MPKKIKPTNPILDEHVAEFDRLILKWQQRLNLADWRIVKRAGRTKNMADVEIDSEHRLAMYRIGEDFCHEPVNSDTLEATAIHEMLHVHVHDLVKLAQDGADEESIKREEHRVINVIERLLLRLAQLERTNAEQALKP